MATLAIATAPAAPARAEGRNGWRNAVSVDV